MKYFGMGDKMDTPTIITPWSFVHALTGYVIYVLVKTYDSKIGLEKVLLICFVIHTIYEMKDMICYNESLFNIIYGQKVEKARWADNSFANSVSDTIFSLIGTALGPVIAPRVTNITAINSVSMLIGVWIIFNYLGYG